MSRIVAAALAFLLFGYAHALAQQATLPTITPPYKVTPLVPPTPVTGQPDKMFVMIAVEFPPGVGTPRHTHFGDEFGRVMEGEIVTRQGEGEWKTVKAGDSYTALGGVMHETKNIGTVPAKTVNAFVVEKGRPIVNPVK